MRRLTFEVTGPLRQDDLARLAKMYRVPPTGPSWPAVAGPVDRRVMRALSVTLSEHSLLTMPVRAAAVSFGICLAPAAVRVGQCIDVCCLAEDKYPKSASGAARIGAGGARAAGPTIRGPTKGCRALVLVLEKREPLFRSASGAGQRACPKTGSPKRANAGSLAESLVAAPTAEGRAARA